MAKATRTAEDLDAELAALEAELAALEGKKKAPAKSTSSAAAPTQGAPTKRKLPSFGRKADPAQEAPLAPAATAPTPTTATEARPTSDLTLWRRDGDAWVRTVPGATRTVRRILDEEGNVVREESADRRDVEQVDGVKAERGAGKLLGRFRR